MCLRRVKFSNIFRPKCNATASHSRESLYYIYGGDNAAHTHTHRHDIVRACCAICWLRAVCISTCVCVTIRGWLTDWLEASWLAGWLYLGWFHFVGEISTHWTRWPYFTGIVNNHRFVDVKRNVRIDHTSVSCWPAQFVSFLSYIYTQLSNVCNCRSTTVHRKLNEQTENAIRCGFFLCPFLSLFHFLTHILHHIRLSPMETKTTATSTTLMDVRRTNLVQFTRFRIQNSEQLYELRLAEMGSYTHTHVRTAHCTSPLQNWNSGK